MFYSLVLSCVIPLSPITIDTIAEYKLCNEKIDKIHYVRKWEPLVSKYFDDPKEIEKSLLIIYCESSGKATAINNNKNGTRDIGLWQFNDETWAWLKDKLKIKNNRYDPETSTEVAHWLIKNDGWYHWNASKHCWNY